jgi:hypothetical protein
MVRCINLMNRVRKLKFSVSTLSPRGASIRSSVAERESESL